MFYKLNLSNYPGGFAAETGGNGEKMRVYQNLVIDSSEGEMYWNMMEGITSAYLYPYTSKRSRVSQIDHLLIRFTRDKEAFVYINQLQFIMSTVIKKSVKAGEPLMLNDMAGISKLVFEDKDSKEIVTIHEDEGFIFYFSVNWCNILAFNYLPLHEDVKNNNLPVELGRLFGKYMFRKRYIEDNDVKERMYRLGWFPFISISEENVSSLIAMITADKDIVNNENKIIDAFINKRVKKIVDNAKKLECMADHLDIISAGIERLIANDYVSSINNIWPRIEGILRYIYPDKKKAGQMKLTSNLSQVIADKETTPDIFFPEDFKEYLLEYYFKDFDLENGRQELSRHTIGHGVTQIETYDKKTAVIGLLIIDQLIYYLGRLDED